MSHATIHHGVLSGAKSRLNTNLSQVQRLPKSSIELVLSMLGIDDPWIWGVYILSIFSALLCVIYGIVNWNREGELEALEVKEEAAWEASEEEMQEKELGL
jgi:hypothetical protein